MENLKMRVQVCLVLKSLNNKSIDIVSTLEDKIIEVDITTQHFMAELKKYVASIGIYPDWLNYSLVDVNTYDDTICILYTSYIPKEYVNEISALKVIKNLSGLSTKNQLQVQQSLKLSAY